MGSAACMGSRSQRACAIAVEGECSALIALRLVDRRVGCGVDHEVRAARSSTASAMVAASSEIEPRPPERNDVEARRARATRRRALAPAGRPADLPQPEFAYPSSAAVARYPAFAATMSPSRSPAYTPLRSGSHQARLSRYQRTVLASPLSKSSLRRASRARARACWHRWRSGGRGRAGRHEGDEPAPWRACRHQPVERVADRLHHREVGALVAAADVVLLAEPALASRIRCSARA